MDFLTYFLLGLTAFDPIFIAKQVETKDPKFRSFSDPRSPPRVEAANWDFSSFLKNKSWRSFLQNGSALWFIFAYLVIFFLIRFLCKYLKHWQLTNIICRVGNWLICSLLFCSKSLKFDSLSSIFTKEQMWADRSHRSFF